MRSITLIEKLLEEAIDYIVKDIDNCHDFIDSGALEGRSEEFKKGYQLAMLSIAMRLLARKNDYVQSILNWPDKLQKPTKASDNEIEVYIKTVLKTKE